MASLRDEVVALNNFGELLLSFDFSAHIFCIIEDGCLEDDIIIVEDVDAKWSRGEEGKSLDQSLCLEENPSSLQIFFCC